MLNRLTMTGRLCADPEMRHTSDQTPVCSFRIANDRDYAKNGERVTDFYDVVAWRSTAEFICKYFTKGRLITVDAHLQTRAWYDKQGNKRISTEIIVDNAYFSDSTKSDEGDGTSDPPVDNSFPGSYGAYTEPMPGPAAGGDFAPDFF